MEFKTPFLLLLIPLVLFLMGLRYLRRKDKSLNFSSLSMVKGLKGTWKAKFHFVPFLLRVLALVLLCVALAGPRKVLEESKVSSEGIDIVLALDCSGSMAAEDFQLNGKRLNRLDVIKKVVAEFIEQRKNDQLGLIGFAGRAYTICPLTTDRTWLIANLDRMRLGLIEDGTAIGSGIASGLSRLKGSKAKSKVIILLTDGVNNAGSVDPMTAAKTAAAMGIKVYTIGAGAKGFAPYPVKDIFGRTVYQNVQIDLDEDSLKNIAQITHAKYFRATDTESLREIYKAIDSLEKTKIEQIGFRQYQELFGYVLIAVLIVLGLEVLLQNTIFFRIP